MTNKANNTNEMTAREQKATRGGRQMPPIQGPGRWKAPTWKYVEGTPAGAIAGAKSMGYEVEQIG
jgi:hypothetical protein